MSRFFTCILRKMDVTIGRNGSDGYGSDFRRWSVMAALYLQEGSLKKLHNMEGCPGFTVSLFRDGKEKENAQVEPPSLTPELSFLVQ
ncbi:hypothetical protein SLE2022_073800 [Rubroshorea leprosula]